MAKIKLVIADTDECYVESLVGYLTEKHSEKFRITYFTEQAGIESCLSKEKLNSDVLLIGEEFINKLMNCEEVNTIIVLSDKRQNGKCGDYTVINKYQTGDNLVSTVMGIYSERNPGVSGTYGGSLYTKVIAVYSPVGGAGKTSVAVGSALQCADRGKQVFYLNLETCQSTSMFFDCKGEMNLSHILYYLKEKNMNLAAKLEGIRVCDTNTGIHFLSPPDSILDLEEISPDEIKSFILCLKQMGYYDMVFIDMSSDIHTRMSAILEACDEVLLVLTQEPRAGTKASHLFKELKVIEQKTGINHKDKMSIVINKFNPALAARYEDFGADGMKVILRIPRVSPLLTLQTGRYSINMDNNFGEALKGLVKRF